MNTPPTSRKSRRVGPGFLVKLAAVRARYTLGSRFAPGNTLRHAARLFCTPFTSSRTRARAATPDSQAVRRDITVDGVQVATYTWADPSSQPYVLFSHGWSSFGLRFEPWALALREAGMAAVAFDQPSHGHSGGHLVTLPEFIATLLGVGRHFGEAAVVVGHSLGGAAASLALSQGLAARRAVLISPSIDPVAAVARFADLVRLHPRLREPLHEQLTERTGIPIADLQAAPLLPALEQPVLVIHDRDDADVPFSEGEEYARLWPGAEHLWTSGLGHHAILADPGVMARALAFCRTTP
jgi:pimeloyl-ACP methyl ester carboxylesterase